MPTRSPCPCFGRPPGSPAASASAEHGGDLLRQPVVDQRRRRGANAATPASAEPTAMRAAPPAAGSTGPAARARQTNSRRRGHQHGHGCGLTLSHSLSPHRCAGAEAGVGEEDSPRCRRLIARRRRTGRRAPRSLDRAVEQPRHSMAPAIGPCTSWRCASRAWKASGVEITIGSSMGCASARQQLVLRAQLQHERRSVHGAGDRMLREDSARPHQRRARRKQARRGSRYGRSTRSPPTAPIGAARRRRCAVIRIQTGSARGPRLAWGANRRRGIRRSAPAPARALITPDGSASTRSAGQASTLRVPASTVDRSGQRHGTATQPEQQRGTGTGR